MKYLKKDFESRLKEISNRYLWDEEQGREVRLLKVRFLPTQKRYYVPFNLFIYRLMIKSHKFITEVNEEFKQMNRENHGKKKPGMLSRWAFLTNSGQGLLF